MDQQGSTVSKDRWKVGRMIDKYGIDVDLVGRWKGDGHEKHSLRELSDFFNKEILRAAMIENGMNVHRSELDYRHEMLTDDNITEGMRHGVVRSLEKEGIDCDELLDDFVTHQAIYTFLSDYHGASHDPEEKDQVEKDLQTINKLTNRTGIVVENTIDRLDRTGRISIGEADVLVNTMVICQQCDGTYDIDKLLDGKSCDCAES